MSSGSQRWTQIATATEPLNESTRTVFGRIMGVRRLRARIVDTGKKALRLCCNPDDTTSPFSLGLLICKTRWLDNVIEKGLFWWALGEREMRRIHQENGRHTETQKRAKSALVTYREASTSSPYFLLSLPPHRARGATQDCSESTSLKELEGRTRLVDGCRVRGLTKNETNRGERPHRLPTAPLQARPEMLNHCPNPPVG